MSSLKETFLKLMENNKIEIISEKEIDPEMFLILMNNKFVTIDEKDKSIVVCFNIENNNLEDVAVFMLYLMDMTSGNIFVGESYTYNEKGNCIHGRNAYEYVEKEKIKYIVESFVADQNQKNFLSNSECFKC